MGKVIDLNHYFDYSLVLFFLLTALRKQAYIQARTIVTYTRTHKRIHAMTHALLQKFQEFLCMIYIFSQALFILRFSSENTNELCNSKTVTT